MSGDTAWLAAWGYGLIGVDLTDPAAPVETGNVPFKFAAVLDVAGQYAYVAKWTNGGLFGVADISDPAAPALVWQGGLANQPYALEVDRSEEHTSELQSLMRNSYAVFCLNKKTAKTQEP